MAMSKFMRTMFVKKMKAARAIVCTKEELEEREWGRSRLRLEAHLQPVYRTPLRVVDGVPYGVVARDAVEAVVAVVPVCGRSERKREGVRRECKERVSA
jgi:hypothetical protein